MALLERHGFAPHVRVAICAEDGPSSPDPSQMQAALLKLGMRDAWHLGDNVVAIKAARASGVVPIAVEPADPSASALLRDAGAARLIGKITELCTLLNTLPRQLPQA